MIWIDYYIAHALLIIIAVLARKDLMSAAKGGNGVLQWPEVTQATCLLLVVLYTLRIIYHETEASTIVYGALLTGAGIGVAAEILKDKIKAGRS
jgi:hypothetical protein